MAAHSNTTSPSASGTRPATSATSPVNSRGIASTSTSIDGISPSHPHTPSSSTSASASASNNASESACRQNGSPEASSSTTAAAPAPLAAKRSRSGCLTCRKRKKKCDETLCEETGGCWRCRNAGYQCEGFRRPPVVFEPGAASGPKNKRPKSSSPGAESAYPGRIKTEADGGHDGNGLADAQSIALGQSSFTSVGLKPNTGAQSNQGRHATIYQESLDMANSLAEFAGLATSSAGWPNMSANSLASSSKNQGDSSTPQSMSFASMLPPPSPPKQRSDRSQADNGLQPAQASSRDRAPFALQEPLVPCEIVGDCLFSGHHLCASCSAVANRLMQPDAQQLASLDQDLIQVQPMPSLTTPMGSRHHSPAPQADAWGSSQANAKTRVVMESLIGYYSTLITCWTQGCDVRGLEASELFRNLIPYLLDSVDRHPALRLSIAAVTAGYVGGARLNWPKDVVAIHQWAITLRADRTSISDCVKANLGFPFPSTPDTIWSASPSGSLSSKPHAGVNATALSPANAERLRRASTTHATLDDLLVGQAQTLKQLALRSLEQAVSEYQSKTARTVGVSFTEKGFLQELVRVNPVLLASMNIAIYAFAEEGMESYYEEAARMRSIVETLLGSFPPVDLAKLNSHEYLGFRIYVWSDVCMAITCGTRPQLQLSHSTYATETDSNGVMASVGPNELIFSLHDAILTALSDIARLRYEYDGGGFGATARRAPGSPVPQWVHDRAKRIQAMVDDCKIEGSMVTGSAVCAMMSKSVCTILIHTFIYRVGALHPVVRGLLRGVLELWTSAGEAYCRSVGCSNFNLPMFVAASVAVNEEDRKICEQAMQIVGHEEAGPANGRALIREVWRRSDITGVPCFWTDLVATGDHDVAFF